MKKQKTYISPQMEIIEVEPSEMLCMSIIDEDANGDPALSRDNPFDNVDAW